MSAEFRVDVRASSRVANLPASAFSYSLVDQRSGMATPIENSCFAEVAGDTGVPYYRVCLTGLTPLSSRFLRVSVAVDGGTLSQIFLLETTACPDAGPDASFADVPNDLGTPDTGTDTGISADEGTDAGITADERTDVGNPVDAGGDADDAAALVDAPVALDVAVVDASLDVSVDIAVDVPRSGPPDR